jgi:hypothetical protein
MMLLEQILVLALAAILLAAHVFYWWDARRCRRDSSRFEMFAVRDELVFLVASRKMKESDPAWQLMYVATNHFLNLSYNSTLLSLMFNNIRATRRAARVPEAASRLKTVSEVLSSARRRVPEFGGTVERMDRRSTL